MSAANKDKDDTNYKHFHSDGLHGLQDVKIHLIDKVNAKEDLIAKEVGISTPVSETGGS